MTTFEKLTILCTAMKNDPRNIEVRLAYFEALADARLTDIYNLSDENKRLRAALEWYADAANYAENWTLTSVYCPDSSNVQKDEGERARKALEGDES